VAAADHLPAQATIAARIQNCNDSTFLLRSRPVISRSLVLVAASALALALTGVAPARSTQHAVSKVTVTFTDATLRASPTTPGSGVTTFLVVNRGKKVHALTVKGPGVMGAHSAKVAAGASARLTVTLKPGAYVLSDPAGLGEYNVLFLDVVKTASLTAKGDGSVVAPPVDPPPMCGVYYTP